eukprot:MONOS_1211.1-p1 / transcript=MONOS_1211.1 / gene=MONOS_1211 / organism=Monocercomonoides_exilis_PA203 / gene_product=Cation-Chloride Cotransporter (CCC) Family Protein / transcript_product=Cation-Chloride Cotransporter (CCC) Family Protein / location=Mono_scaffold00020:192194-196334(+) / protein_length=1231 / sequence_SO=supercontig / SO=protein_coding / is_pseudo=false
MNLIGMTDLLQSCFAQLRLTYPSMDENKYYWMILGIQAAILFVCILFAIYGTKLFTKGTIITFCVSLATVLFINFWLILCDAKNVIGVTPSGEETNLRLEEWNSNLFGHSSLPHFSANVNVMILVSWTLPLFTQLFTPLNVAQHIANPTFNIPYGTLISVLIATLIYIVTGIVMSFRIPARSLSSDPFILLRLTFPPVVYPLVALLFLSSAIGHLISAARVLFMMADDKVFSWMSWIAKRQAPSTTSPSSSGSSYDSLDSPRSYSSTSTASEYAATSFYPLPISTSYLAHPPSASESNFSFTHPNRSQKDGQNGTSSSSSTSSQLALQSKKAHSGALPPSPHRSVLVVSALILLLLIVLPFAGNLDTVVELGAATNLGAYLLVNVSCLIHTLIGAPNWRSSFKANSPTASLCGAILCAVGMFTVSPVIGAACVGIGTGFWLILTWVHRGSVHDWGQVSQSYVFHSARRQLLALDPKQKHIKYWRPNLLFFCSFESKQGASGAGSGQTSGASGGWSGGSIRGSNDDIALTNDNLPPFVTLTNPHGFGLPPPEKNKIVMSKKNPQVEAGSGFEGENAAPAKHASSSELLVPLTRGTFTSSVQLLLSSPSAASLAGLDEEAEDDEGDETLLKVRQSDKSEYFGSNNSGRMTLNICNDLKKGGLLVLANVIIRDEGEYVTRNSWISKYTKAKKRAERARKRRRIENGEIIKQDEDDEDEDEENEEEDDDFDEESDMEEIEEDETPCLNTDVMRQVEESTLLMQRSIAQRGLKAFPCVVAARSFRGGVQSLILSQGIGGMKTNTCVFRFYQLKDAFAVPMPPIQSSTAAHPDAGDGKETELTPSTFVSWSDVQEYVGTLRDVVCAGHHFLLFRHFDTFQWPKKQKSGIFGKIAGLFTAKKDGMTSDEKGKSEGQDTFSSSNPSADVEEKRYIDVWLSPIALLPEDENESNSSKSSGGANDRSFDSSSSMALLFGHILSRQKHWQQYKLRARLIVENAESAENKKSREWERLRLLLQNLRIIAEVDVVALEKPRNEHGKDIGGWFPKLSYQSADREKALHNRFEMEGNDSQKQNGDSFKASPLHNSSSQRVQREIPSQTSETYVSLMSRTIRRHSSDTKLCFLPLDARIPPSSLMESRTASSTFYSFLNTFPENDKRRLLNQSGVQTTARRPKRIVESHNEKVSIPLRAKTYQKKSTEEMMRERAEEYTRMLTKLTDGIPPVILVFASRAVVTRDL